MHTVIPASFRLNSLRLICFSHLRWDFVYQRPQHLLSRLAQLMPVVMFEEPLFDATKPYLELRDTDCGVQVATPHLVPGCGVEEQRRLLDTYLHAQRSERLIFWFYTPMAMEFCGHIEPALCVYDCMDELSAFRFAPSSLIRLEKELLDRADLVFTGGASLFASKRGAHRDVHLFPSSIDKMHFGAARAIRPADEPEDQMQIQGTRAGFAGVIDERMDLELVRDLARLVPDVQFVMIGPIVKIDSSAIPRADNLHWIGPRTYRDLPGYFAGWSCGLMPFAMNESTRFISPTKTPEYLAAGLPVVSTPIRDVVDPYGALDLVHIAANPLEFAEAMRVAIVERNNPMRLKKADEFLSDKSWDVVFEKMYALMCRRQEERSLHGNACGIHPRDGLVSCEG